MQIIWQKIAEILRLSRLERRWHRVARLLGIVVIFCTTYMLVLPALTMENETYCGLQEHSHDASCYAIATNTDAVRQEETEVLVCGVQEHIHNEICIIEELAGLAAGRETYEVQKENYIASLDESILSSLEGLSEEEKAEIFEAAFRIEAIPTYDEFSDALDKYYYSDDTDGEAAYITAVQQLTVTAYCTYQNLNELQDYVFNSDRMFEFLDIFNNMPQTYTTGTSQAVPFNYINQPWVTVAPVVVHGGTVGDKCSNASAYWHAVVVEYDSEHNNYYVSYVYLAEGKSGTAATIKSLKASTAKGFVLVVWSADSGYSSEQKAMANTILNVEVGDTVTVSSDPTKTASGEYKSEGYGTVTFKEGNEIVEGLDWYKDTADESDSQIVDGGGKTVSSDRNVTTTKTINGTSEENVFDITLTVETYSNIQTFLDEPDMAVVVVMDISNSMNSAFGSTTRYYAARNAAANFITQFAENTSGLSQIGFVAFNTHVHDIFELQPCSTTEQANALINEMKEDTADIALDSGYANSKSRFTNVEGGLAIGYEMLKKSGNSNQYIILLSDGFPTTYVKSGYTGYEPFSSSGTPGKDGVFYDNIRGSYCTGGTSYSDPAAIKARVKATEIKNSGAKIFTVGIDIGGQTVQGHINAGGNPSIVDRMYSTYEIGSATDGDAYKNWLQNSIGSGYYYDSTNQTGITNAFNQIFAEIKTLNEQTTKTVWTATDPMPVYDEEPSIVGFVHFYDKDGNVVGAPDPETLTGTHTEGGENTAEHDENVIHWDLKKSGYTSKTEGNTTTYYYTLKYRVRLVNEKDTEKPFEDGRTYETNGDAYLEYRSLTTTNGVQNVSDLKNVSFSKPAVKGYLSSFSFRKEDSLGNTLPGAEFTVTHDDNVCTLCHGDGTALTDNEAHDATYEKDHFKHVIETYKASSDENGLVEFTDIPSGHTYVMTESGVPEGYLANGSSYSVNIAYDVVTVTETTSDGAVKIWNGLNDKVVNYIVGYVLPATGGSGTVSLYIIGGMLTAMSSVFLLCRYRNNRERRRKRSEA